MDKLLADEQATPCILCGSTMVCYNTAVISGETGGRSHYLMACNACGYGPAQAFPSTGQAIRHWNQFSSTASEPCSHTTEPMLDTSQR